MKSQSKYQLLQDYLRRSDRREVTLTFAEIEQIIESALPDSARRQRAWWSNRSQGARQATAWRGADFLVEKLDLNQETVTFRRPPDRYTVQQVEGTILWHGDLVKALRRHMGLTQQDLAKELGVRQQTVSEWEKDVYQPTRASSKYLTMVAEKAGFTYGVADETAEPEKNDERQET